MRCEHCRNLLLDHLYGLLDAAEVEAVEAHLAACPACAAAADRATRDQRLLASAAKSSFPHVTFTPPIETVAAPLPVAPAAPVSPVLPAPQPSAPDRGRRWFSVSSLVGWGVAASLLIAIPAVSQGLRQIETDAAAANQAFAAAVSERDATRRTLATAEQAKATAAATKPPQSELVEAKKLTDGILAQWFEWRQKQIHDDKNRKLGVEVIGPAAVQPGAPNDFTIVVHDRQNAPGMRQVEAQVRDEKDRVLYRQPLDHERKGDRHDLHLPRTLWSNLKPESDLYLVVATVDAKSGVRTEVQDKIRLLGPVYATMLATDKPLYRPGERLFFRSLTLDRSSFRPPEREQELRFELRGPDGKPVPGTTRVGTTDLVHPATDGKLETVLGPDGKTLRGVGTGAVDLPADLAAGTYTLTVSEIRHPAGYTPAAPASRKVEVRPFTTDRFLKKLEFEAASFRGGETVGAWCEVRDLNAPVAGATVVPTMVVDGQMLTLPPVQTGADGRASLRFTLPPAIDVGDARLQAGVNVGGVTEVINRRVPVMGRRLSVEFFPEGGNLVAGAPCRVYLRATSPLGAPVDVRGIVTDGREIVAQVETFTDPRLPGANRGLGSFTFTPKVGTAYWFKLETPSGIHEPLRSGPVPPVPAAAAGSAVVAASRTGFLLPRANDKGVVMEVAEGVTAPGKPIVVQLRSVGGPRELVVGAYTRGRLMDTKTVTAVPGMPAVVHLAGDANPRGGVTRVTVFENAAEKAKNADLIPVAERLVFRTPTEDLKFHYAITPAAPADAKRALTAGENANLAVRATDETGRPAAAVLYAAIADQNAVSMADGKLDRLLTTHFLLAGEVQKPDDLEHVDFLLTDNPTAAQALDLLLGTQGWRRFAEQHANPLHRRHTLSGPEMERFVMLNGQYQAGMAPFLEREKQRAYEAFWPQYEAAARKLEEAVARSSTNRATPPVVADTSAEPPPQEMAKQEDQVAARSNKALALVARSEAARKLAHTGAWIAGAGAALLLLVATLVGGSWLRRLPFLVGGLAAVSLAFLLEAQSSPATETPVAANVRNGPTLSTSSPSAPAMMSSTAEPKGYVELKQAAATQEPTPKQATVNPEQMFQMTMPKNEPKPQSTAEKAVPPSALTREPESVAAAAPAPAVTPLQADKTQSARSMNSSASRPVPEGSAREAAPAAMSGLQIGGSGNRPRPTVVNPAAAPNSSGGGFGGGSAMPFKMAPAAPPPLPGGSKDAAFAGTDGAKRFGGTLDGPPLNETQSRSDFLRRSRPVPPDSSRNPLLLKKTITPQLATPAPLAPNTDADRSAEQPQTNDTRKRVLGKSTAARLQDAAGIQMPPEYKIVLDSIPRLPPLVVREYANLLPMTGDLSATGVPSLDTILWQPVIVLPGDGAITIPFRLNADSLGYQVIVAGHTLDGRIGAVRGTVAVTPTVAPSTK